MYSLQENREKNSTVRPGAGPRSRTRNFRSPSSLATRPGRAREWYSRLPFARAVLQDCSAVQGEVSSKMRSPHTRDVLLLVKEELCAARRPFSPDLAALAAPSSAEERSFSSPLGSISMLPLNFEPFSS